MKTETLLSSYCNCIHQHAALWKVKSSEYSDRNLKNDAYKVLVKKYKEVDPKANKEIVKKKINSLRTSYRKQLKM